MSTLSVPFEELVLLAIREGEDPTGTKLQHWLSDAIDKPVAVGALYTTLERATAKGLIKKTANVAIGESGKPSAIYGLTAAGKKELARIQEIRERVLAGCKNGRAIIK